MVNPSPVSVARAERAVAVLRECSTFDEARPRLLAECDEGAGSSLRAVFARAGFDAPSAYLRGATKARGARIEEPPVYSSRPPRAPCDTDPAPPPGPAAAANDEEADIAVAVGRYTGAPAPDYDDDEGETVKRRVAPGEWPDRTYVDRLPERLRQPAPHIVQAIALFPDIHAGFHDERALSCAIKVAELGFSDWPVEMRHVVQLGDVLDSDAISPHPRSNMPPLTFEQEVGEARRVLARLEAIEAGKRSLCLGNHDFWVEKHKIRKCPEFSYLISVDKLLELDARGWDWVPYHRSIVLGRTRISHEFGKAGGNAAVAGLNSPRGKVFGHTHRLCVTYAGMVEDLFRVSATLGYLGTVEHANYGTDTNFEEQWCQGMGFGYLDSRGFLWLQPVPIVNGTAIFNGRVVCA